MADICKSTGATTEQLGNSLPMHQMIWRAHAMQEADRVRTERTKSTNTKHCGTRKRSILNILHVPKTGGSSVWHTIADFYGVKDPPIAYDYFHEAIKTRLPFEPAPGAVHFLCVTGLLPEYHREIHDWHAASHIRLTRTLRSKASCHRVLTHTHFPARFCKPPEGAVTLSTTRESGSRFLSHAAHLLRELRRYQEAVANGECEPQPLLRDLSEFSRGKSVVDFCVVVAALRPTIATHQLRYLLASLCSDGPTESFEIMAKWSNREVIREFKRLFDVIRNKTTTMRLEKNGQYSFSAEAVEALGAFGIGGFQVNRVVLETVTTPRELKENETDVVETLSVDRSFRKNLEAENDLLRELHGLPSLRSRVRYFWCGSACGAHRCA